MTTSTLPAGLILRLAADLIQSRAEALRRRASFEKSSLVRARDRISQADTLIADVRRLRAMRATGEVPAGVAGLLLAWCGGHNEAVAQLEDIDERICDLRVSDVRRGCEILLGAK